MIDISILFVCSDQHESLLNSPSLVFAQQLQLKEFPRESPLVVKKEPAKTDWIGRGIDLELKVGIPASSFGDNLTTGLAMRSIKAYGRNPNGRYDVPLGTFYGVETNRLAGMLGFQRNTIGAIATTDFLNLSTALIGRKLDQIGEQRHDWRPRVAALTLMGMKIAYNVRATIHNIHTINGMGKYVRTSTGCTDFVLVRF